MTITDTEPVVDDLSITLLAGRPSSSAHVIGEAQDAERLGFKRIWMPERYTIKEAGAVLGAVGASTERIGIGTGPMTLPSRPPAVTASIATTLQSMFGDRVAWGVGRGAQGSFILGHGFSQIGYETLIDWSGIIRRLWRGETIDYDGPAGSYHDLRMVDLPECPPPELIFFHLGGPKASRYAADPVFDAVGLANMTSPEAMHNSIQQTRAECERIGRDPEELRFIGPVTTAPDADEQRTRVEIAVRVLVYLNLPQLGEMLRRVNGWDKKRADDLLDHPVMAGMKDGQLDQHLTREQLVEAASAVPEEWLRDTAVFGTSEACARRLRDYKDAGIDEIDIYAGSPAENAGLIRAWRNLR